jgi:hypothetical protein
MSSKDLKDLLGAVADEGRDTVDLDEGHLVGKIRTRRRRQRVIVSAASVGTAAVIAAVAVSVVPNLRNQEPTVASDSGTSGLGVAIAACGGAVSGVPRQDAPLELTAIGPLRPAPNPAVAFIDLQLTNTGSTPLDAQSHEGAGITVAQNGVVVGQALPVRSIGVPVKLQPGESLKFQAGVSLRRCDAASAQTDQPLAAGSYQLYATRSFNPNDGGQAISVQGGPWTVELK